jgi:hypothetical protein
MDRHEFLIAGIFSGLPPQLNALVPVLGALLPLGLAWRAVRISDPISKIVSFAGMVAWTGFLMFLAFPELSNITHPALYMTLIMIGLVAMVNIDLRKLDSFTEQLFFTVGMFSLTVALIGWWLPIGPPFPSKVIFVVLLFVGNTGICLSKISQTIAKRRKDDRG